MTHDQIDRMLRDANPVPALSVLEFDPAPSFLPENEWRKDMTSDTRPDVDSEPTRSRTGLVTAMAVAALILIGALVALRPWIPTPTAGESAIETANAFLAAFWSFDADGALEYMAPELVQAEDGASEFSKKLEQDQAWHYQMIGRGCEVSSENDSGVTVVCPFDYHALGSDQIGLDPFSGDSEVLTVVDGLIVAMTLDDQTSDEFSALMWDPMKAWILGEHPEDYEVLYGDASWLTDASIALWDVRIDDYAAYVNSSG